MKFGRISPYFSMQRKVPLASAILDALLASQPSLVKPTRGASITDAAPRR